MDKDSALELDDDENERGKYVDVTVRPLARQQIEDIAVETTGQSSNGKWFAYRRHRITGSMFGKVLDAYHRPTECKHKMLKQMMEGSLNLDHLEPIKWGREHEKDAIADYCRKTGRFVKPTGIWLFPSGELGASPDGLVYLNADSQYSVGIIEVKCPFSVRNRHFKELHASQKLPAYITSDLQLNSDHDNYHQVQGELYATGAAWCDFVMWTTMSCLIIRVYPNPLWLKVTMPKLTAYYRQHVSQQ